MRMAPPKSTGPRRPAPPPGMMYGPNDALIPIPTKGGVRPVSPVKPGVRPGVRKERVKTPGMPKPGTPGVKIFDDSGMAPKNPSGYTNPVPTTDKTGKPLMAKGGMVKKGMNVGGMKTGMNKGGMANCGASMKPTQGKGK